MICISQHFILEKAYILEKHVWLTIVCYWKGYAILKTAKLLSQKWKIYLVALLLLVKVCLQPLLFLFFSHMYFGLFCLPLYLYPGLMIFKVWLILIILIVTSASFTQIDAQDEPFLHLTTPLYSGIKDSCRQWISWKHNSLCLSRQTAAGARLPASLFSSVTPWETNSVPLITPVRPVPVAINLY